MDQAPRAARTTFAVLGYRDFRIFWIGACVSFVGSWVQMVAMGWYVYQLTGSKWWLGVIGLAGGLPATLLMLFGGAVADRFNRRQLLFLTQSLFAVSAFTLFALIVTERIALWHLVAASVLNGILFSVDGPARQAMVRELVGERDLATGVALQSAAFNIARVIGPLVGGVIYASLGPAWCFFTNGASFAAILIALALVRPTAQARSEDETFWASFRQGIAQVRTNARMRAVVALTAATSLCAFSVYGTLMPALAKDRLGMHDRDTGYGLLFAAVGLGSLVAVWLVDRFANEGRRGRLMVYGAGAFGLALIVLSAVQSVAAAMAALALVGLASVSQLATANTLTQTLAPEALRGRAIATHMFALGGLQPLGAFLAGVVAQRWGVAVALAGGGTCLLVICVLVVLLRPDLARLE